MVGAPVVAASPPVVARDYWPTKAWRTRTLEEAGFDRAAFDRFVAYAFPERSPEPRKGIRTDGLLVVRGGYIVYERYAAGYGPDSRHYGWSMSKTVTNALVGVAEKEGLLRRSDKVADLDRRRPAASHPDLRVEHLLRMRSGIEWRETYEGFPWDPLESTCRHASLSIL